MIVLDTSVVVKWFVLGEDGAEEARAVRDMQAAGNIDVIVPSLALYELCSALGRRGWLPDELERALTTLVGVGIIVVQPTVDLLVRAAKLCRDGRTSFYDEAFVALAELTDSHMITADEEHYDRVRDTAHVHLLSAVDISDVPRWDREGSP